MLDLQLIPEKANIGLKWLTILLSYFMVLIKSYKSCYLLLWCWQKAARCEDAVWRRGRSFSGRRDISTQYSPLLCGLSQRPYSLKQHYECRMPPLGLCTASFTSINIRSQQKLFITAHGDCFSWFAAQAEMGKTGNIQSKLSNFCKVRRWHFYFELCTEDWCYYVGLSYSRLEHFCCKTSCEYCSVCG